jgi:hypothetical protein
MALGRSAEHALEEIVSTQTAEDFVLLAVRPGQDAHHRRLGIVVETGRGHPTQPGKGADMALQERFELLGGGSPSSFAPGWRSRRQKRATTDCPAMRTTASPQSTWGLRRPAYGERACILGVWGRKRYRARRMFLILGAL